MIRFLKVVLLLPSYHYFVDVVVVSFKFLK